ncbi:3-deoxy-D-manno-octulosonic acid transferase [Phaeovulum vinaykumarii]|uniref:3-deoxy-D-manno-octulosonic acid transferase n=1 Tax=Phaeovulum vinaykumarii TaxID=407234 RepID=A0A1N7JWD2_9RHOB|nr:glycosyltransferase N-terminal domain-containing protein [Phaeovulum vinaykumarii]SIS53662.1 3-deoxy-D-manno-octulosonic-acid transferase [Phaeovulum vinaykumarii]SOB91670.1 3-deoxy-D-manno-octulosonic-acid transferase [Phaeovulum vinaykumarii]
MTDTRSTALLAGYDLLSRALAPFAPLLLRRRLAAGKEDPDRWPEKLGQASHPRPRGRLIWVHAVSVGESLSVLPLLERLVAPGGAEGRAQVLLTTGTLTSARLLAARAPEGVIHQFAPLDLPGALARFLDHWRPDVAVMVESEFWPRLLRAVAARGIPLLLVNARISDRSARAWARVPATARALLGRFRAITVPDAATAARLGALGVPADRLHVVGALKSAAGRLPVDETEKARLAACLGGRPCWLAASTHPGEEALIAEALAAGAQSMGARSSRPGPLLILAPRHPERGPALRAELSARGLRVAQRALGQDPGPDTDIYLADTLGEMGLWFDLSPVAFIGGSLVAVGGHNAYEPALHGAAILHGPMVSNFADLYARLDAAGGARCVDSPAALAAAVADLGADGAARAQMVAQARAVLAAETDPLAATAALIAASLSPR